MILAIWLENAYLRPLWEEWGGVLKFNPLNGKHF